MEEVFSASTSSSSSSSLRRQRGRRSSSSSSSSKGSSVAPACGAAASSASASSIATAGTEEEEEESLENSSDDEDDDEDEDEEEPSASSSVAAAAVAARAAALAAASPPEPCASWEWLPEGLLCDVLSRLGAPALRRARLTCRRWRACADTGAVESLAPSRPKAKTLAAQFPRLKALDLGNCPNVRNRTLAVLSSASEGDPGLRLRALAIGGGAAAVVRQRRNDGNDNKNNNRSISSGRPRVSNAGIASLSRLTTLESLAFSDCASVTNNGLDRLGSLTRLRALALCRNPRVGDRGLRFVSKLTLLSSVDLYGLVKVTDATLLSLVRNLPRLEALATGFTRISDAGVAAALGGGREGRRAAVTAAAAAEEAAEGNGFEWKPASVRPVPRRGGLRRRYLRDAGFLLLEPRLAGAL